MEIKELENIDLVDIRGMEGVKEASITINDITIKVAVAHGLKNVSNVLDKIKEAKAKGEETPWHFIEVMACRGGCVGGGGQPYGVTDQIREKRSSGLYQDDRNSTIRCSHHNTEVRKLYDKFLGEPNSKIAHKYLHTHYKPRPLYK